MSFPVFSTGSSIHNGTNIGFCSGSTRWKACLWHKIRSHAHQTSTKLCFCLLGGAYSNFHSFVPCCFYDTSCSSCKELSTFIYSITLICAFNLIPSICWTQIPMLARNSECYIMILDLSTHFQFVSFWMLYVYAPLYNACTCLVFSRLVLYLGLFLASPLD